TTSIGTASDELSGLFGMNPGHWRFAPQISVPFRCRTWAIYRVSKAQREIALAQYEKTIQTAFKGSDRCIGRSGHGGPTVIRPAVSDKRCFETYRLADKRYEKGIDSYLGVLDAQRSLYAAQQG
ncbi:MAG: multidrug transporter, partial [Desulfobacterales bacterium]